MFELELRGADGVVSRHRIGGRPFYVGRGATNDLILLDDTASTRHLTVWAIAEGLWVEDLRSRNGTWVNGNRITGAVRVQPGDEVRVGERTRLYVAGGEALSRDAPQLEDLDLGVRHTFTTDRFTLGAQPGADIGITGEGATVILHRNGEIWLGQGEELRELEPDVPFEVGGRLFCLRRPARASAATREVTPTRYPYALVVTLDGGTGAEATLRDTRDDLTCSVVADNRALLLYVLGRRVRDDLTAGLLAEDAGWCTDEEVAVGIWGRSQATSQLANLNVLVWRLRKELESVGFDAWCIEKRRRHIRVRVERVDVR